MQLFSQSLSRHAGIIMNYSRRARVSQTFLSIQVITWKGDMHAKIGLHSIIKFKNKSE
jgi:hypothetical protein